jgi:hypothetical protein
VLLSDHVIEHSELFCNISLFITIELIQVKSGLCVSIVAGVSHLRFAAFMCSDGGVWRLAAF